MVILELIEMLNEYNGVQQDKGILYTQQGFDIDNQPVPTEQKGINHDELIGFELSGKKPTLPPIEENKAVFDWINEKIQRPDDKNPISILAPKSDLSKQKNTKSVVGKKK